MNGKGKAFRLLVIILALAGWSLLSRIGMTEEGNIPSRVLIASTGYPGAASMQVEEQITTPLEGRLSLIPEIETLRSFSTEGHSRIEITLNSRADLMIAERKIRMMCRLQSRTFPKTADYTSIAFEGNRESRAAMKLNFLSALSQDSLYRWLNPRLAVRIGSLPGSEKIEYPDLCQPMMEIGMNASRLEAVGITPSEVVQLIGATGQELSLAESGDFHPEIRWSTMGGSSFLPDSIFVSALDRSSFPLAQFIQLHHHQDCESKRWLGGKRMFGVDLYFHPEGWTKDNIEKVTEALQYLESEAAGSLRLELIEINLAKSLNTSRRVLIQCGLSAGILAILLLITLGKNQAVFLLLLLFGSLGISFLALNAMKLSLSVSVIGGMTIGLGMAADNGIMLMSVKVGRSRRKQLVPIMAATLTTLVPLLLVQWAELPAIKGILGFCTALSLVLSTSLVVCWAVIPLVNNHFQPKSRKRIVPDRRTKLMARIRKDRIWIHIGLILLIGIPIPDLPERIFVEDKAVAELYRNTFGSYQFQYIWQPRMLDWIGGVSRPFIKQVNRGRVSSGQAGKNVELLLKGTANSGTYPEQLCELGGRIEEEYLRNPIPDIQVMRSCGPGAELSLTFRAAGQQANHQEIEKLYRWLFARVRTTSGISWSLSGIGKGWSNEKISEQPYQIKLQGYQYLRLIQWAGQIADSLRTLPGVLETNVGVKREQNRFLTYQLDHQNLAMAPLDVLNFTQELEMNSIAGRRVGSMKINGRSIPFTIRMNPQLGLKAFLAASPIGQKNASPRSRFLRSDSLLNSPEIYKENQVYEVRLTWSYAGSVKMGDRLEQSIRAKLAASEIQGCRLKPTNHEQNWDLPFLSVLIWLLPVLGIMFVICAIFLESLLFAFLVLLTIPLGWIGCMAFIILSNGQMDAGAIAGFFLVTGLSVNHGIFLLMPIRTMRRPTVKDILNIYLQKVRPVILTMISTALTFGPFCWPGAQDTFWSSLAFVTISGLLSGVFLTLTCLPAFPGILPQSK